MIRTNKELLNYFDKLHSSKIQNFAPNHIIIKQDSYVRNIYVIKSGILKCSRYNNTGTEFVQEFLSDGEIIGEIEILTENNNSKTIAEIIALTDVECYKISISDFKEKLIKDEEFNKLVTTELASKIRYKALRHSYIQTHTLEEILIDIKKNTPDILALIHKNDLANYFGVTLRSFNRILKNIK